MSVLIWLLLTLAGLQAPAAKGSFEGVVVRLGAAAGNDTLSGVQVTVRGTTISAVTDGNGRFSLRNINPGKYLLTASREGFVMHDDPQRNLSQSGLAIALVQGQAVKNVVIPMIPAPVISGRVFDPTGAPLAAAVAQAYGRRYTPYGPQLKSVKKAMTDDLGEYRLFWLASGEYIVGAGYSDWLRRAGLAAGVNLSPNVPKADDGYTTVFYGGSTAAVGADTVRLTPGAPAGNVDIILSDAPRFRISGNVFSKTVASGTRVIAAADGNDLDPENDYSFMVDASGRFEITGLSPGAYVLLAIGDGVSSELIPVSIANQDVDRLAIPMYSTINLSGKVSLENGSQIRRSGISPESMQVSFVRSSLSVDQRIDAETAPDGTFTISDLGPGEYEVLVSSLPASTYVKSIRMEGREMLTDRLRINPDGKGPIEIVLGIGADVRGIVAAKDGELVSGAQVVLIPESRYLRRSDRYITVFTDAVGAFQMTGVPPGRYTAYAFEQILPGAYFAFGYSPRPNARFATRGVVLTAPTDGSNALHLTLIPASETIGGLQ